MNFLNSAEELFRSNPILFFIIAFWVLFWKGLALWKAARLSHKYWFIALLFINMFGILEILYIYFVAGKYTVTEELEEDRKK